MSKKKITYGEAYNEIQDILQEIENHDIDIDKLSVKVKQVSGLIEICKSKLHKTEEDVEKILKSID